MFVDENHILCVENAQEGPRMYSQVLSGFVAESYDKKVLVWHKKQVKEIDWKDLWNTMSVFFVENRGDILDVPLDPKSIVAGIALYKAYDEEAGQVYYFLPKYSTSRMQKLCHDLDSVGVNLDIVENDKWVIFTQHEELDETHTLSFFFGLSLAFGNWELREGDLKAVKIHVPLFGQYVEHRELFDMKIDHLQKQGLFLQSDVQERPDGLTYQIVVSDYEVLQIWANMYEKIENIEKISKYEQMLEAKTRLMEHLKHSDGANEQKLADLDWAMVKLLTK